MKKAFTTITAFCLGVLISISIVACADDFATDNQEDKELQTLREIVEELSEKIVKLEKGLLIQQATYSYGDYTSKSSFTYDTSGRITNVSYGKGSMSISYADNIVNIHGIGDGTWKITTNGYNIASVNQLITSIVLIMQ